MKDGRYTIEVTLTGGSGRATVKSPTELNIESGRMTAEIEWSSGSYDYMKIGENEYFPVNDEGNSVFIIDVPELDRDFEALAETVAMSEPHLIEYTLNFNSATLKEYENSFSFSYIAITGGIVLIITAVLTAFSIKRKKKKNEENN